MKKTVVLMLATVLLFALFTACGGNGGNAPGSGDNGGDAPSSDDNGSDALSSDDNFRITEEQLVGRWDLYEDDADLNWASSIIFFDDGNIVFTHDELYWTFGDYDVINLESTAWEVEASFYIVDNTLRFYLEDSFVGIYKKTPSFIDEQNNDFLIGRWDIIDPAYDRHYDFDVNVFVFLNDGEFAFGREQMVWRNYGIYEDDIHIYDTHRLYFVFYTMDNDFYVRTSVAGNPYDTLIFKKATQ